MEILFEALAKSFLTLAGLFSSAAAIGAGIHLGLRLGAKWFGPIQATVIHHTKHYWPDDSGDA